MSHLYPFDAIFKYMAGRYNAAGIVEYSILLPGILYIIARAVTLVLAFTSLRELPPEAFDTVHWTTFIPRLHFC